MKGVCLNSGLLFSDGELVKTCGRSNCVFVPDFVSAKTLERLFLNQFYIEKKNQ